jgi:hypothetical protein
LSKDTYIFPFFFSPKILNKALADVNMLPPKQYQMQKKDMNRIKDVIEEEVTFFKHLAINFF